MGTSIHLPLWLTPGTSKKTTTVSRCCWVSWSMTIMVGRSLETSKRWHFWWASKAVSPSFLVFLASRTARTLKRYYRRDCPQWIEFSVGKNNIKLELLIDPWNVLMPPLYIKLGLIKKFVMALDKEFAAFKYLQGLFPWLSEAKVNAGIFIRPQIKIIVWNICQESENLKRMNKAPSNSFIAVVHGFLGNQKAENNEQPVQPLIKNYTQMSLKVHIVDAHLDKFKEKIGAYLLRGARQVLSSGYTSLWASWPRQYNDNMMGGRDYGAFSRKWFALVLTVCVLPCKYSSFCDW